MEQNITGLDELLAGYAAGTLAAPAHALVGAHLEMTHRNHGYVASLEALAGQALEDTEPVALSDRETALNSIFDDQTILIEPVAESAEAGAAAPPSSLRSIVGKSMEELPWKSLLPGVRECKFGEIDGCNVSLLWVRGGRAMPSHTHHGTELTLVLKGGFSDADGHYARGDIAFADDNVDHRPIADEGEDCICFAVTEGRLQLTGIVGRFIAPFVRT
ncbi:MAG: cupin domain-containing protein [Roseibium sp.]|nr:cupin domain-containing protein [Roseibium sp.]